MLLNLTETDWQFSSVLMCQASRMDDQRSSMPPAPTLPDDDFFNLVQRLQSDRLEAQRSAMPEADSYLHQSVVSRPTVPVSGKKKKLDKKNSKV